METPYLPLYLLFLEICSRFADPYPHVIEVEEENDVEFDHSCFIWNINLP